MGAKRMVSSFIGSNKGTVADCRAQLVGKSKKVPVSFSNYNKGSINRSYNSTESGKANIENYTLPVSDEKEVPTFIEIENKEQFLDFVKAVNEGLDNYENKNFRLVTNIDLNHQKISSVGATDVHAFKGIFDGNGYTIQNFRIAGQKTSEYTAFFSHLKGATIINLAIQGKVSGGKQIAGFVGKNEGGLIHSCSSDIILSGKGDQAGFACENNGVIENCFANTKLKNRKIIMPIVVSSAITAAASVAVVAMLLQTPKKVENEYFPPIPVDEQAVRYDYEEPVKGKNSIDCFFSTKVKAHKKSGKVDMNFKNPGRSNQHMVMQLQITDQELIDTMGSSGRTKEEQKELKKNHYDPKNSRIVVGESGTIPPGYKLDKIDLHKLPNGKKLKKGNYNAIVVLSFYDIETNQKAMVNTQTPVKLVVV